MVPRLTVYLKSIDSMTKTKLKAFAFLAGAINGMRNRGVRKCPQHEMSEIL
jgi:hypothetical protein